MSLSFFLDLFITARLGQILPVRNMLLLYESVFLPGLVYNCEAWSNLTCKDYPDFEKAQETFCCV